MDIWRRAVDATHDFLAPHDRAAIEDELSIFLPQVHLSLAVDHTDNPLGFMFLHEAIWRPFSSIRIIMAEAWEPHSSVLRSPIIRT